MSHWEPSIGASDEWYTPPHVYDDIRADRDAQVRELKREGLSPITIARKIGCSPPTVREAIRRLAL